MIGHNPERRAWKESERLVSSSSGEPTGFPPPKWNWGEGEQVHGEDEATRPPASAVEQPPNHERVIDPQASPSHSEQPTTVRPQSTEGNSGQQEQEYMSAAGLLDEIGSRYAEFSRPEKGWRRFAYDITNGRLNKISPEQRERMALIERIQGPLTGEVAHVGVWSQKGGVGKTTTLAGIGAMAAMHRTDKILGLDVNPDGGSLAVKVPRTTDLNILNLRDALRKGPLAPVEFDRYVNHASHRFDTITMSPGQKPEQPLTGRDYEMISTALRERYPYKIIYVDCGTDLSAPVMDGVLAQMKQLIVVTSTIKDEATVAAGGLEALMREGRSDLVKNAITVLVEKAPRDPDVHIQREIDRTSTTIRGYFERLTKTVIPIPYDSRVRLGDVFNPDEIRHDTHMAYLRVTAEVVDALRGRRG